MPLTLSLNIVKIEHVLTGLEKSIVDENQMSLVVDKPSLHNIFKTGVSWLQYTERINKGNQNQLCDPLGWCTMAERRVKKLKLNIKKKSS